MGRSTVVWLAEQSSRFLVHLLRSRFLYLQLNSPQKLLQGWHLSLVGLQGNQIQRTGSVSCEATLAPSNIFATAFRMFSSRLFFRSAFSFVVADDLRSWRWLSNSYVGAGCASGSPLMSEAILESSTVGVPEDSVRLMFSTSACFLFHSFS